MAGLSLAGATTVPVALGAVLVFGVLALVIFARSMRTDRRRRPGLWGVRETDAGARVPVHGPRAAAARRPRHSRPAIAPEDRLRQVERLHAKGHLTEADVQRARDEVARERP